MPSIRFNGKHAFNVQFSPFFPKYIACATSEKFGFKGSGSLIILENDGSEHLKIRKISSWSRGLLDVSWLRGNENLLVASSCDGSLQVWKLFNSDSEHPVKVFKEHRLDTSTLDTCGHLVASGSWDSTIKIWDITGSSSLTTFRGENGIVHSVRWSRSFPNLLISVSEKAHLVLWDKSCPLTCIQKVEVPNLESLDCDWSYLDPYLVVVCGNDGIIRWWDIRSLKTPCNSISDQGDAHAKIKFSPHYPNVVATTSYNLNIGIWDTAGRGLETIRHHSAFIPGIDFNQNVPGEIADCGLDSLLHVYTPWSLFQVPSQYNLRHKL